jgi:electron transport complex protein RnfA
MSAAVTFVLTLATVVTYLLQKLLVLWGVEFLQTILFILIIAALVQMIEIMLKKVSHALYQALGVFLPLITTNCCILGVALIVADSQKLLAKLPFGAEYGLLSGTVYAFATAIGFGLALILFAGIREQLAMNKVPEAMKGTPIALLTAGLLAMAFMGFSGVV